MNSATLIGNLVRDPELRTGANTGTSVCNFTIAVSRRFEGADGTVQADFIPVVCFKVQADNCAKFLRKGSQVAVRGSIQTRNYEAKDGTRRYVTEVIAHEVQFLTKAEARQDEPDVMAGASETDDELPF